MHGTFRPVLSGNRTSTEDNDMTKASQRLLNSAAVIVALGLGASSLQAQELSLRLTEDPETLYNVNTVSLTAGDVINTYFLERLVYFDDSGAPRPWLASGWDVSADQKVITFTLRDGIVFHDGTPFDAAAVAAHFGAILDPANASPQLANMGPLVSVEATGPMEVTFTYSDTFAPAFSAIAGSGGGINSPTAVEQAGDGYGRAPVGTGPFIFERWLPGTLIEMRRNPDYKQFREDVENTGLPHVERIVLNVIQEEGVAQAALETGELSAAGLSADTIPIFADNPDFNTVLNKSSGNLVFVEFNQQEPPFDDPEFRRAIGYAIDRESAVLAAWAGYGGAALSPLSAAIPGYDPAVAETLGTPYDPEKAVEILTGLGWVDSNGDGTIDKDGMEAEFRFLSYAGFTHIDRTMQVIQANLKDVGISVDLETSDWGAFYPSLLNDGWHMDLMRWTDSDADVLNQLFLGDGHRDKLIPDPVLDETLVRCSSTMEPQERLDCISQAQRILLENMTVVPVLTNWGVVATQKNVSGYGFDYLGFLKVADIKVEE
jgi:peptide/nickel transport system substrate-binding protein